MEKLRLLQAVQECKLEAQRRESSYFEHLQEGFLEKVVFKLGLVRWTEHVEMVVAFYTEI